MNICITGVSRGIGRALCKELLAQGHHVWGCARSEEDLSQLAKECGECFRYCSIDLTNDNESHEWCKKICREFDPDVVVLNAGVLERDTSERGIDGDAALRVLHTNLLAPLQCIEAMLPHFLVRERGRFVVISSMATVRPLPHAISYTASKVGLSSAVRALDARYRHQGVQFACVYPGPLATGMGGWKASVLTPPPQRIARRLARFVVSSQRTIYLPRCSTTALRLTRWIPDRLFFSIVDVLRGR